jgi:hypothetical protein
MSRYNVHIYTSESKFSIFPFIHCIQKTQIFLLVNTATIYKIHKTGLKYFYILQTHVYTLHKYITNEDDNIILILFMSVH